MASKVAENSVLGEADRDRAHPKWGYFFFVHSYLALQPLLNFSMLPRNLKSKNNRTKFIQVDIKVWKALRLNDLEDIAQKVKEKFKWDHEPRPFQLDAIVAQLKREDVLIHAGTGSGKTAVAAGPHAHEKMEGKVTFMISPLIALQNEQVSKTTHNHL